LKTILFLFLIYTINIYANDKGCTISLFKKKEATCSTPTEKKKITIAPIIIENTSEKESQETKQMEVKLHKILNEVTQYKNKNTIETNKLREELNAIKKEFNQYKVKQNQELKKVKKQLYVSNKKAAKNKNIKKEFTQYKAKKNKKLKEVKRELSLSKKKINNTKEVTRVQEFKKETPIVHKIVRKMNPSPILMYDTPWIEIIVENNIDIYELALKYYGNKEAYKKIYTANQNVIADDFKIYDGMSLIIPMTDTFKEQPIMLNTY